MSEVLSVGRTEVKYRRVEYRDCTLWGSMLGAPTGEVVLRW